MTIIIIFSFIIKTIKNEFLNNNNKNYDKSDIELLSYVNKKLFIMRI